MSATNRGAERLKDDAYFTPKWAVHRLLEWMQMNMRPLKGSWLEPCVGNGAIVRAVEEFQLGPQPRNWTINDINPIPMGLPKVLDYHQSDFRGWATAHPRPPYECIITNPPYSLAKPFIEKSLHWAEFTFMLLRLNFLGSAGRRDWLDALNPTVLVLPNRPAFSLNDKGKPGTDATEYAWFLFTNTMASFADALRGRLHILKKTSSEEIKLANQELVARLANKP